MALPWLLTSFVWYQYKCSKIIIVQKIYDSFPQIKKLYLEKGQQLLRYSVHVLILLQATEEIGPNIHLMYPFMYIHRLYSDMISNVISQSSVSWSVYMRDDDGSVMVVKSAPRLEFVSLNHDIEDNFFDDGKIDVIL